MGRNIKFQALLGSIREALDEVPEHRSGNNKQYTLTEVGLSAFSVFHMQSPSFLNHQRDMQRQRGQNNATGLFGIERLPSDSQIRNLLDPIDPAYLRGAYWSIYEQLEEKGHLAAYEHVAGTRLVSLDGSQYFSSQKIHCDQCRKVVKDEQVYYSHGILLAVLSAPEQKEVICLEPEFLTPQDVYWFSVNWNFTSGE